MDHNRRYRLELAADTHQGSSRIWNEDAFGIGERRELLLIADGLVSRVGGDLAARLAVDTVRDFFDHAEETWPEQAHEEVAEAGGRIVTALNLANDRLRQRARELGHVGEMVTTFAAALALPQHLWIAHVGDSRVYRARDGLLERLTSDHRVESDPWGRERLPPEEVARAAPSALTRALGLREVLEPDLRLEELRVGDILLLATKGLTSSVLDEEIARVLREHPDVGTAVTALVDSATSRGGRANVTAIVAKCMRG